jgi:hypothetical protein
MKEVAQTPLDSEWAMPVASDSSSSSELFVINLYASMAPIPALPKQLKGFEKYKLYQVSRQEDGRRRYRLRLGFFSSEADAEMVVSAVRSLYPTAFTGCMTNEDQRYAFDSATVKISAPIASVQPQSITFEKSADQPRTFASTEDSLEATAKRPALTTLLSLVPDPEPALERMIAESSNAMPTPSTAKPLPPIHTAVSQPLDKPLPKPAGNPIVSASIVNPPLATKARAMPLSNHKSQGVDNYVPVLDTTLTIRALTRAEADDPNKPKWFVVQLALSEQPVNLDAMPKLDIFAAYSLYSVALMESGTIRHALRLGFFREQVSAEAVMGYLRTFFGAPTISQVSASEHDRFVDSKLTPTKPSADKIVNLDNKREASSRPTANIPAQATSLVNAPAKVPAKSATQRGALARIPPDRKLVAPSRRPSFLSRLIGRQLD